MSIFTRETLLRIQLTPPANPPAGQFPSTPYAYAPTHVAVHYSPTAVLGSKVWLGMTPYPGYNDDFENPCIYRSDDSKDEPFAKTFIPYAKNPIVGKCGEPEDLSFNADIDLILHQNELHVLHRPVINKNTTTLEKDWYVDYFPAITSGGLLTDFGSAVRLYGGPNNGIDDSIIVSPALVRWNNKYRIYDLVSNAWNSVNGYCQGLRIMDSDTLGVNSHATPSFGRFYGYKIEPWHISVFEYGGKLYAIVCGKTRGFNGDDSGRIYLGEFDANGADLYIYRNPLTDFRTYRSDAYIDENGLFVLYAALFNQDFGATPNTKTILAGSIDFAKLLKRLKS